MWRTWRIKNTNFRRAAILTSRLLNSRRGNFGNDLTNRLKMKMTHWKILFRFAGTLDGSPLEATFFCVEPLMKKHVNKTFWRLLEGFSVKNFATVTSETLISQGMVSLDLKVTFRYFLMKTHIHTVSPKRLSTRILPRLLRLQTNTPRLVLTRRRWPLKKHTQTKWITHGKCIGFPF